MDTTQQLHLSIGRILQRNQLGGHMNGYSTLLTHAFHLFTHCITSYNPLLRKKNTWKNKSWQEEHYLLWLEAERVIIFFN
jgi:hypothetical protein